MPLTAAPWWQFSRATVESDRDEPGVYEMGDASDSVVYIGSSDALKRRLIEHLNESGTCIRTNTVRYRIEYTQDYPTRGRQLYDKHVKNHGKPPKGNEPPAQVRASLSRSPPRFHHRGVRREPMAASMWQMIQRRRDGREEDEAHESHTDCDCQA